jgi:hypothetical protein
MSGVLIVDDHPIVLQGCRRILEDARIVDLLEARDAVSGYEIASGSSWFRRAWVPRPLQSRMRRFRTAVA